MLVRSALVFVYATFMASSVQASTVQAGASPAIEIVRSFSPGSAFIVDSYRSEDGHTYYEQQSSKLNDKPIVFGAFSLGDDSGRPQENAHDQFGGSFSNTTKIGVGGGFNGGGGIGGDGISSTGSIGGASPGFNGGKELFSFAGLPLNIESNALAITLARLDDDANRPGFEGGGYAGLGGAKENVSATPLPPTWTMMLTGLVGFGLFAYRRKSKSALTAA